MPVLSRLMRWWDQDLFQGKEDDGARKGAEREVGQNGEKCSLK